MVTDPFENFAEQQRSYELLDEHREALVADALELLRSHPDMEVVGLILDADASETAAMRTAVEQATGQTLAGRGFLGVAPRSFVTQLLRANAPATLEWLPPSSTREGVRQLPLVAVTKRGVRFAAVACVP
jgi:hypothetical protein